MHQFALLPAISALVLLLPSTAIANPFPHTGIAFLRRAIEEHVARAASAAPQTDDYDYAAEHPYEDYVPFSVDSRYRLWSPESGGVLNEAFKAGYEYIGVTPPPIYVDPDYVDMEGIYAPNEDILIAFTQLIGAVYDGVNAHAPYGLYDFDLAGKVYDSAYCVWQGDVFTNCWFNDLIDYGSEVFGGSDPYKLKEKRQEAVWQVYATSPAVNYNFAATLYEFLMAVDRYGRTSWEYNWAKAAEDYWDD